MALDPSKVWLARHGDDLAFVMLLATRQGIEYVNADLASRHVSEMAVRLARMMTRAPPQPAMEFEYVRAI